ncbi:glycosyltransferase [Paraburkholderia sp. PREW-6R]|uniref:glycosyltransferase n=1 Tax=Paraburkholderia sp. PREW-6R TaxID=3141544 RepID=UPI0031F4CBE5
MSDKIAIIVTPADGAYVLPQLASLSGHATSIVAFVHAGAGASLPESSPAWMKVVAVDTVTDYYAALNRTLHPLIEAGTAVLFVSPHHVFDNAAIGTLQGELAADSLYGFALPRTNVGGSAPVPRLRGEAAVDGPQAFDAFFDGLPARLGGGIVQGLPVLVRASVLATFGRLSGKRFDLADALATLFIRANRRGFSAVVCNRALFFVPETTAFGGAAERPVIERAKDYYRALDWHAEFPEQRLEKLLWHRLAAKPKRQVLFDIRNLAPGYNGTAQHILSLMKPLCALAGRFGIEPRFWVLKESAEFHRLDSIAPGQFVTELTSDDLFDASIRLSQPWSFSELRDQAFRSMINMYLIMDAIAWDCHYIRMPHIDGVWRTAAAQADGFAYNSAFTQRAFQERFPDARKVPSAVSYCSLDPSEYYAAEVDPAKAREAAAAKPYLLVVGNQYYHKGLYEVVRVLAAGFPETQIKVLGEISEEYPNVEQIPSGLIAHDDIDRLFRECTCLVFPSHYEGFGLPILKALSFGKPVIARHSSLLDEIRDRVSPVDGIVPFTRNTELLRAIGEVLARESHWRAQKTQAATPRDVHDWERAAHDILTLLERGLASVNVERCVERLEFFYRFNQFDTEREGWSNADQNKIIFEVELEE